MKRGGNLHDLSDLLQSTRGIPRSVGTRAMENFLGAYEFLFKRACAHDDEPRAYDIGSCNYSCGGSLGSI